MNREKLTTAIKTIAERDGYNFYCDGEALMPRFVSSYPALWLTPPRFESMKGRNHGKIIYSVKMYAMQDGLKYSTEQRNAAWAKMEEDLVDIFSQLSEEDFVVAVEQLKVQHSSATMTNHAEVAATATANVITFF